MEALLADPWFFATAIPAVVLIGVSKGGLGGATALLGVPLMALTMSRVKAAAVLLPILIVMDLVSLWTWRGYRDNRTLKIMLPGAMAGIAVGWALAALVTPQTVKLMVGLIAALFVARWVWMKFARLEGAAEPNAVKGTFWAVVAGYTSFVAHAGGPPFQMYALPLHLHPRVYTGTSVIFFAIVNAVKLVPYFMLGQFDASSLTASAVLVPIAPLATLAGAWVIKRMRPEVFYPFTYTMVAIVAVRLIWEGVSTLAGG